MTFLRARLRAGAGITDEAADFAAEETTRLADDSVARANPTAFEVGVRSLIDMREPRGKGRRRHRCGWSCYDGELGKRRGVAAIFVPRRRILRPKVLVVILLHNIHVQPGFAIWRHSPEPCGSLDGFAAGDAASGVEGVGG